MSKLSDPMLEHIRLLMEDKQIRNGILEQLPFLRKILRNERELHPQGELPLDCFQNSCHH